MLPDRLTGIDETNRDSHFYIVEGDRCLFFSERITGGGYQASPTNQLIHNYKYSPTQLAAKPYLRKYKEGAIRDIAAGLRGAVARDVAEAYTWVAVPTSQLPGDADYDDRLIRTLDVAFRGYNADIRSVVRQTETTRPDHTGEDRLPYEDLYRILEVDRDLLAAQPLRPKGIVLFDDVLVSGKHYKCCKRRLQEVLPDDVPIVGVFVARRVFPDAADDIEDLTLED